jgi:hypothetical protein BACCOPRO_01882
MKSKSNIHRILVLMLMSLFVIGARAQSKFHVDLDYHYYLGLYEYEKDGSYTRNEYKMGGHALTLATRYDVTPRISVGWGTGLAIYTEPTHTTMPLFATVRYKAFEKMPNIYAFADLGLGVRFKGTSLSKGPTGNIGMGYTKMLGKHFGVNFRMGYNLRHFRYIAYTISNEETGEIIYTKYNHNTRHSISFNLGLTF